MSARLQLSDYQDQISFAHRNTLMQHHKPLDGDNLDSFHHHNYCLRCHKHNATHMERCPELNLVLHFCSLDCLKQYKMEVFRRGAAVCFVEYLERPTPQDDSATMETVELGMPTILDDKPTAVDSGKEQMEPPSTKRRRICNSGERHSKKRKEPRPHPSYRLNKRYWDDIRAGRRPRSASSSSASVVLNAQYHHHHHHPPAAVFSGSGCITASPASIPYLPLSFFAPPMVEGPGSTVLPSSSVPYTFSSGCTSIADPGLLSFSSRNPRLVNHSEHDTTVDVTTVDEKNFSTEKIISPTIKKESRIENESGRRIIRSSDDWVDEIADKLLIERIKGPPGCTQHTSQKALILPIPLPFIIPILLPVTEQFIAKYFR